MRHWMDPITHRIKWQMTVKIMAENQKWRSNLPWAALSGSWGHSQRPWRLDRGFDGMDRRDWRRERESAEAERERESADLVVQKRREGRRVVYSLFDSTNYSVCGFLRKQNLWLISQSTQYRILHVIQVLSIRCVGLFCLVNNLNGSLLFALGWAFCNLIGLIRRSLLALLNDNDSIF